MIPSAYQQAIYDYDLNRGNLVIEAVAGSGKTHTITEKAFRLLAENPRLRMLFVAFNTSIVKELKARLPQGMDVMTTHSLGLRMITSQGKVTVDDKDEKIKYFVQRLFADRELKREESFTLLSLAKKLVSIVMSTMTDYNNPLTVAMTLDHYAVDLNSWHEDLIKVLPELMRLILSDNKMISFDEMIYLPATGNYPIPRYDVVFIDEIQDMASSQIALLLKLQEMGAKIIGAGDRNQAIYGFRGADYLAIPRLIEELKANVLPLSICYRCPTSHLDLARKYVPAIEDRPDAPVGEVLSLPLEKIIEGGYFRPKDTLAICRVNAPLATTALRLIRMGIPAVVLGRDIGENLIALIKKIKRGNGIEAFMQNLNTYQVNELKKLRAREASDNVIQSLNDRIDTIHAVADGATTVEEIIERIVNIFSDINTKGAVELSTVHKAKGRQAKIVIILAPDKLPLRVKDEWAKQQESNIVYVSLTRAMETLIYAEGT